MRETESLCGENIGLMDIARSHRGTNFLGGGGGGPGDQEHVYMRPEVNSNRFEISNRFEKSFRLHGDFTQQRANDGFLINQCY